MHTQETHALGAHAVLGAAGDDFKTEPGSKAHWHTQDWID
jgi:hypothetical protein